MNENGNHTQSTRSSQNRTGANYLVTVGVLLVIIIALLAVLWVRERRARVAAEQTAATAQRELEGLKAVLGRTLMTRGRGGDIRPVQRDDLPYRKVDLDGRRRAMLELGASSGRRLGFRPGDLILIGEDPPTTQPATDER